MRFPVPGAGLAGAATSAATTEPDWAGVVEQRVLDRLEEWIEGELDDRVLRIIEDKLREETERRVWMRGTEVF